VATAYTIPHHLPVVWTSSTSFQVGISPPRAHIGDVPPEAAPLIHALIHGVSHGGIELLVQQHGIDRAFVMRVMESLSPVFESKTDPTSTPQWTVWGSSPAVRVLVAMAEAAGIHFTAILDPLEGNADHNPTIVVSDYIIHPHWADRLTRTGTPHLPIVFSDQTVTLGPIIRPGLTPCLICRETHQRDHTPHWLEIGTQLWGQQSALHHSSVHAATFALLMGFLDNGLSKDGNRHLKRADYRPLEEVTTWHEDRFHPRCTCRGLSPAEI
jgi:hypothetical protein